MSEQVVSAPSGRGSDTWQRRAALVVFILVAIVYIGPVVVHAQVGPWETTNGADALGYTFWFSVFSAVGIIIAFHRPGNPIAWICLAFSGIWAVGILLEGLLAYEATHPGTLGRA